MLGDRGLRVEVCDAGDDVPRPRGTSPEDESGRGLALVAALSDAWGAYPRPCGVGKAVWFELNCRREACGVQGSQGAPVDGVPGPSRGQRVGASAERSRRVR
ncbi:ATP-binding protein [Streptomyces radiopugnans]|uniref:ATP-binding protein n=1 Tax=Streptomyces radiopugnans TaxID=403935 RepID=UPI003F1DF582